MKKNPNAKYIERFEHLVRVLRGLSRHERAKHFNMEHWGVKTDCGTTMCAAGFCASDTWFRRRGFRMSKTSHETDDNGRPMFTLEYQDACSWEAVQNFFGHMDGDGESYIFGSSYSQKHPVFAKPKSVGDVIRAAKARIKLLKEAA